MQANRKPHLQERKRQARPFSDRVLLSVHPDADIAARAIRRPGTRGRPSLFLLHRRWFVIDELTVFQAALLSIRLLDNDGERLRWRKDE